MPASKPIQSTQATKNLNTTGIFLNIRLILLQKSEVNLTVCVM